MRQLAEFIAVLACGLFAGAAVYVSLVEHPARMECGVEIAATEFPPSYRRGTILQVTLAALGLLASVAAWLAGATFWWLVGGVLLGSVIPFTLIVILPTNKQLLNPTLDRRSAETERLFARWGRLHSVRSILSALALLLFLYLVIFMKALDPESDCRHCSLIPDRCILRVAIPMLTAIKLLHTVVWAILAGSIVVLPLTGVLRRFRWAAILSGLVLLECGVLAVNGGRCPLSDMAQRFTDSHANNFDIYLPNWLAQYNKVIFGVLFFAGELVVLGCWFRERSAKHQDSSTTTATSNFE